MIGTTSEVKNDSEDNEADDSQNLDRAGDGMYRCGSVWGGIDLNRIVTHAKTNSASPYAPIYQSLVSTRGRSRQT